MSMIPTHNLIETAIKAVKQARLAVNDALHEQPELRFQQAVIESRDGSSGKKALTIDITAETSCRSVFQSAFGDDVVVLGEESLGSGLVPTNRICAIVDMIDGTDLLEMGVPLWCSAIVLLNPSMPSILGSVIALATGEIYVASVGDEKPYVYRNTDAGKSHLVDQLTGPSDAEALTNARVGFYGQKAKNIVPLLNSNFVTALDGFARDNAKFRIYNFAGNPMMVKMVDRLRDAHGNVIGGGFDIIFDICGQKMHDVTPGAFIAKKAGAYICDLNGIEITYDVLAHSLLQPNTRMKYVLASTKKLADEFLSCLIAQP